MQLVKKYRLRMMREIIRRRYRWVGGWVDGWVREMVPQLFGAWPGATPAANGAPGCEQVDWYRTYNLPTIYDEANWEAVVADL